MPNENGPLEEVGPNADQDEDADPQEEQGGLDAGPSEEKGPLEEVDLGERSER